MLYLFLLTSKNKKKTFLSNCSIKAISENSKPFGAYLVPKNNLLTGNFSA